MRTTVSVAGENTNTEHITRYAYLPSSASALVENIVKCGITDNENETIGMIFMRAMKAVMKKHHNTMSVELQINNLYYFLLLTH
jgi:hypothetical protein